MVQNISYLKILNQTWFKFELYAIFRDRGRKPMVQSASDALRNILHLLGIQLESMDEFDRKTIDAQDDPAL